MITKHFINFHEKKIHIIYQFIVALTVVETEFKWKNVKCIVLWSILKFNIKKMRHLK